MSFEPNVGDVLEIEGWRYTIARQSTVLGLSYGQEGRAGFEWHYTTECSIWLNVAECKPDDQFAYPGGYQ